MLKGVIFDMDGVLVSTDTFHYHSWMKVADEENIRFDENINHQFRGVSRHICVDIFVKNAPKKYNESEKKELAFRKNKYFLELIENITREDMLPGALAMLEKLKVLPQVKTALASASKNATHICEKLEIIKFLDAVTDGNDIINSKPHPEIFLKAAKKLFLLPEQCIVVEDAKAGITAAQKAGMKHLGIGTTENVPNATKIVNNLSEISISDLLQF